MSSDFFFLSNQQSKTQIYLIYNYIKQKKNLILEETWGIFSNFAQSTGSTLGLQSTDSTFGMVQSCFPWIVIIVSINVDCKKRSRIQLRGKAQRPDLHVAAQTLNNSRSHSLFKSIVSQQKCVVSSVLIVLFLSHHVQWKEKTAPRCLFYNKVHCLQLSCCCPLNGGISMCR